MSFTPFIANVNGKRLQIMQATDDNIPDLLVLEEQVYSGRTPWNKFSFERELEKRHNCLYLVVYYESMLVAFIGARFTPEETHITNIAVAPAFQNMHIGRKNYYHDTHTDAMNMVLWLKPHQIKRKKFTF